MSLKGILAINGMPGLYKVVAQTKSGFIVESLVDQKRMPVTSAQRISMLEDISVYTITDDLPLNTVFLKLAETVKNTPLIDPKSDGGKLKEYFKLVVPDYDVERVYPSDIKKILNWYNLVKDMVEPEEEVAEDSKSDDENKDGSTS